LAITPTKNEGRQEKRMDFKKETAGPIMTKCTFEFSFLQLENIGNKYNGSFTFRSPQGNNNIISVSFHFFFLKKKKLIF